MESVLLVSALLLLIFGSRPLFEMLRKAEQWLAENSYSTDVRKWDTEEWGEIPADFGRK